MELLHDAGKERLDRLLTERAPSCIFGSRCHDDTVPSEASTYARSCGSLAEVTSNENFSVDIKLMKDVLLLELVVKETKITPIDDEIVHVKMQLDDDPEILSSCAWGLIFSLGGLSFEDARPRGYSENDFVADDRWTVGDMLEHLSYESGRLHFHADYVRGRCVKTTIDIDKEGRIIVETANRGEALTRWIAKLQGKKSLGVIEGGHERADDDDDDDPAPLS